MLLHTLASSTPAIVPPATKAAASIEGSCEILDVVFIVHTALERTSDKAATMGSAVGVEVITLPSPSENVLLVDAPVIGELEVEVEVEVVLVDFVLDFSPLVDPVTALELELVVAVLDLGVVVTAAAAVALVVTAVAVAVPEALVVAVAVGVGVLPSH